MNATLPDDVELQRMQSAADWLIRLDESPGDERVVAGWFQWCSEHPGNLPAFKRAQTVWHAAATAGQHDTPPSAIPAARSGSRQLRLALAAAIVLAALPGLWWMMKASVDGGAQSYATPVAGLGSSVLPDGSKVELGAQSRITTHYCRQVRSVSVDAGEAFFIVKRDATRPFIVTAHGVQVTAIGTEFNVRRGSDRVVVTVREGKVQVERPASLVARVVELAATDGRVSDRSVSLEAGKQAVYVVTSSLVPPRRIAVASVPVLNAASWRQGALRYENEPLSNVVADLNRYSSRRIRLADAQLAQSPFTGTIFSAHIEDALKALEDVFLLRVVVREDAIDLEPR